MVSIYNKQGALGEDLLVKYLELMTFNEQKLIERADEINHLYPNIQNLIYDLNNHYLCEFLPKNASAPWLRTKESTLYIYYIYIYINIYMLYIIYIYI